MMSMTVLEKELVAVAISVAAGCRPCTTHHLAEAKRAGASEADIAKAVAGAVCVRTSATEGMRRHALGLEPSKDSCGCGATDPQAELVALGASLAVNCTSNIDKHLTAARGLKVSQQRIDEIVALVAKIRAKAIGHADARIGGVTAPATTGCC